jgi:phospholipase C
VAVAGVGTSAARAIARVLAIVSLALGGAPAQAGAVQRAHDSSSGPCGALSLGATDYTHVVWIWMENHSYGEVIGSSEAPYINALAGECGIATNYHNITHPSLPNYVAATSGLAPGALAQFASDCRPSRRCSTPAASIFGEVSSWRAYEESMPKSCDRRNRRQYAVRHNPAPYYTTLGGCAQADVPYPQLAADLSAGTLPSFSFITPNLTNDMHDGSVEQGDAWLSTNLPAILDTAAYRSGTVVVFITWDEGAGGSSDECATNTTDAGCRVATIVVSPSTLPGTSSSALFNHYSLLASSEQLLGVPLLGEAASAASMLSAFGL